MQLESGIRLGPYEIVERVGAGGMGEVYRARDTRLSRIVAIKVLPSEFAQDARLRARFEREAKIISALNHPHICSLHDIGRENGLDYLVMEYCEGTTLANRLERGALTIEQVLQFGIEIADALSRAHRAGIIHRDLKPSNIMLTKEGVKLLDFGLAKQAAVQTSGGTRATTDLRDPVSEEGTFVGTVAYMAPEVLAGKEADARSDLFAFGVVLYEMLTGRPAFSGTSTPSVMASILEREPQPVRELQPRTPPLLERVIEKCLRKDPDQRWESAHDAAEELRWIQEAPTTSKPPTRRTRLAVASSVAFALLALAAIWAVLSRQGDSERVVRLAIPLPTALGSAPTGTAVAISPDSRRIAYFAERGGMPRLYVRDLDSFETIELAGTGGGEHPFFSADGHWIGFFERGALLKVRVAGGTTQTVIAPLPGAARGAWWAPDDTIYFSRTYSSGLWSVSANGGASRKVTEPNSDAGENSHRWPQVLPDGKHVLFTMRTDQIDSFDQARIAVLSLENGTWKTVLEGGTYARYISTGHLLFARAGALYATAFDLSSMSVRGVPRKVLDGVVTIPGTGAAEYSVNDRGDLVYLPGGAMEPGTELLAVDRSGQSKTLAALKVIATKPRVSPDERKIAFNVLAANDDIWVYDFDSGTPTRVSFEPGDEVSVIWTPDSARLVYSAAGRLIVRRADGAGEAEELVRSTEPIVSSCSPDGEIIAYTDIHPATGYDLWTVALKGDRTPRPLLRSRFDESDAHFSPDGKWIAYVASESPGRVEVYIRPISAGGGRWQASIDGGMSPRWSANGKEVFYRKGHQLFAVPVSIVGSEVRTGKPQFLFSLPLGLTSRQSWYDVTRDGFVTTNRPAVTRPLRINVILNWTRELR